MVKTYLLLLLFVINSTAHAQQFLSAKIGRYQYGKEPRTITNEEILFDENLFLKRFESNSVLDGKHNKSNKAIGNYRDNKLLLNLYTYNNNYDPDENYEWLYILEKKENAWNLYLGEELLGTIRYSEEKKECSFSYADREKKIENFYKENKNNYTLFNTHYILKNNIFYEQNLDDYEYYDISYNFDRDTYHINYSYEGLKTTCEFTRNYYCIDFNQICLLGILRNDIDFFLSPYLFCRLSTAYHATSYLSEGKVTYEPEHLQWKDGLPWASGNGKGIGDIISIREFEKENPSTLKIMNGYQDNAHPDYYEKNSRIKTLKVTNTETGKSMAVTVKDKREPQSFQLGELGAGNAFDMEVVDVYPGSKYDDLCIQYLVIE